LYFSIGPSQVAGDLSPEVKRPGHEADHPPASTAVFKNTWSAASAPTILLHGIVVNWASDTSSWHTFIF